MVPFKQFIKEANFYVNSSRTIPRPGQNTQVQPSYPLQVGPRRAPVTAQPQASPPPVPAATPTYTPVTQPASTPQVPPAVTQKNAPVSSRNGQLTTQELKPVGKYSAGPSGLRQWYRDTALLSPRAADAFNAAQQAYGRPIPINSAYRSIDHQKGLSGEGHRVVGRAGTSRHGLGMAVDLQPNTPYYSWFKQNGPQFGWHFASIAGDPYHFEFRG